MQLTQLDSGLVVPSFLPTNDLIASLNKVMLFLSTAMNSKFPPINNQLKTLSNPRIQATVQDGRVIVLNIQGHFLVDMLEEMDDCDDLLVHTTTNFKVDHLDAYDSNCDDEATAYAIFMASLSPIRSINEDTADPSYDSELLSEVPHYDTYHEDIILNDVVQEKVYNDHTVFNDNSCDELMSNSIIISYVDYMVTIENDDAQYVPPTKQDKNAMILSVIEQMKGQVEQCNTVNLEAKCVNESLSSELERYKENVKISQMRGIIVKRNKKS
ncbi:hypothetical protein Tco_0852761 [Tanacetum coccineum]